MAYLGRLVRQWLVRGQGQGSFVPMDWFNNEISNDSTCTDDCAFGIDGLKIVCSSMLQTTLVEAGERLPPSRTATPHP